MSDSFNALTSSCDFFRVTDEDDPLTVSLPGSESPKIETLLTIVPSPRIFSQQNVPPRVMTKTEEDLRELYRMMQQPLQTIDNIYLFYRNRADDEIIHVFYEDFVTKRGRWRITVKKGASRNILYPPVRFHSANGLHNYLVRLSYITTDDVLTKCTSCKRSDREMRKKISAFFI